MSNQSGQGDTLRRVLAQLHDSYQRSYEQEGEMPLTDYIDEWEVPCYRGDVKYGMIAWRAVEQHPSADFTGVERGLECQLDAQVKAFFGHYFAADLHVAFEHHPITLSQVISVEDVDRLQRNLIAHVLMKRRLEQPDTLFIGTSDESEDLIISVDNSTGVVGLEFVGKPQHAELAANLTEFLQQLSVRVVRPDH